MKIAIELPSWLGDTIMTTPAIENIINTYAQSQIIFIGNNISLSIFQDCLQGKRFISINKKFTSLYRASLEIGRVDIYISFRGSKRAWFLKKLINSKKKFQYDKKRYDSGHQVERYNKFINESLNLSKVPGNLKIYSNATTFTNNKGKLLGLNPGASYGSAKRWDPEKFGMVGEFFSSDFDLIIFGGNKEIEMAKEIEKSLAEKNVLNFVNLAGRTSIQDLIGHFKNLSILVTGDSGPMHLAAALNIPTVTIFGPTKVNETSQWKNSVSVNVKTNLPCQPCMKRTCPLIHHKCMNDITSLNVIDEIRNLIKLGKI